MPGSALHLIVKSANSPGHPASPLGSVQRTGAHPLINTMSTDTTVTRRAKSLIPGLEIDGRLAQTDSELPLDALQTSTE
ncbi:hypothetical protein MKOR_32300 [Mycolicibacillus koreensis]|nr:hypothetical protein MKOR_32300 [Mycolicibacillus koreensis]